MSKKSYPTFGITDLAASRSGRDFLTIDRFKGYLAGNPHLHTMHRHSFYHLVYFTEGRGKQVIDFETFPIRPGCIYFMNPAQVHKWMFTGPVDGFIINFSPTFFEELQLGTGLPERFAFFRGDLISRGIHHGNN